MSSVNSFNVIFVYLISFVHACNGSLQTVYSVDATTNGNLPPEAVTEPAGGDGHISASEGNGAQSLFPWIGSHSVPFTGQQPIDELGHSITNPRNGLPLQHQTENDPLPVVLHTTTIGNNHSPAMHIPSSKAPNLQKIIPPPSASCPATCQCYSGTVYCKSGLWQQIPQLPQNYSRFVMEDSNITVLDNNSFSQPYPFLTNVRLYNINAIKIQGGAFAGLNSLEALELSKNKLNSLPTNTFLYTPLLGSLALTSNNFQTIPHHSICVARNLVTLLFNKNRMKKFAFPPCYQNMSKLSTIDISDNPIVEVNKEDFAHLRLSPIHQLEMKNCKLTGLNKQTFFYVPGLTIMNLSGNKLSTLPDDILLNLTKLSILYVEGNRFHSIIPAWFVNTISTINLGSNGIQSLNVTTRINLSNVTDLALDNNKLDTLYGHAFNKLGLYNLIDLSLRQCSLLRIDPYAFGNLTNLTSLRLSENKLTAQGLQKGLIGISSSLQNLYLDNLHLEDMTRDIFSHLSDNNITTLILDTSEIKNIPNGTFQHFGKLRTLSLKNNKIIEIDAGCFKPLSNLDTLLLSKNKLVYCIDTSDAGLSPTLTYIDISGNLIQRIEPKCVRGLDQLELYKVENNKLGRSGLLKGTFTGMGFLKLDLSHNQLTVLANDTLNNMSSLTELYIKDNKITHIETGCFEGLSSLSVLSFGHNPTLGNIIDSLQIAFKHIRTLRTLDLSSCGIGKLVVGLLQSLPQLDVLILTDNGIISWEPDLFHCQVSLSVLHLRHNRIVTMNSSSVQYLPALREIYLESNPLICSCNLLQFRDWILSGRFFVDINVNDPKSYACALPPKVKGVPLLDVDLGFKVCGPIDAIIGGSVGGFAFVLLVVFSVIMYRYRWYIRYGCFLLKGRLRQRRNQERLLDCEYDAFVSYNHGDQRWVIEHLLPELEYRGNIRLCLHDRDWLAGPDVADNIIDSIENSHKTILILSNHFAQSQWCELEMSMAQHKLLTSQKDVLVLVLKDPIDDCYMTNRLRHLMTTQTYLAWEEGDPKKVRRFWKALRQAVKGRQVD